MAAGLSLYANLVTVTDYREQWGPFRSYPGNSSHNIHARNPGLVPV